jgi:hypothetical protein
MYIEKLALENVRTFTSAQEIHFHHPRRLPTLEPQKSPSPRLNNVNLIFGDNASGKTTILESIALVALGPAVIESRVAPRPLVRFQPLRRTPSKKEKLEIGNIKATLALNSEEVLKGNDVLTVQTQISISKRGELERFSFEGGNSANWERVYDSRNDSFFVVAYGATRRVESDPDHVRSKGRSKSFDRLERINSIIEDGFPLTTLPEWFPNLKRNTRRWSEVVYLINYALGKGKFRFSGERDKFDYLFDQGGMGVPFRSLSDGYKAFLGWVTDLLYHLHSVSVATDKSLREIEGIVLVDEIDLHLHPVWQMEVIERLSDTFPRLQFILTSHSPLIAGSVEWMNITPLRLSNMHRSRVVPFEQSTYGLDADQILVSELFGLDSTRARFKRDRLRELKTRARHGDNDAAKRLLAELSRGLLEKDEDDSH